LASERIELKISRRSTLPDPKPILLGQPKWVINIVVKSCLNLLKQIHVCMNELGFVDTV